MHSSPNNPWPVISMGVGILVACIGIFVANIPNSVLYPWGWILTGIGGIVFSYSALWTFTKYK